jgi:hypothetical protein
MKLRFTTRDFVWLAVALALAIGWWIGHSHMQSKVTRLRTDLTASYEELAKRDAEMMKRDARHFLWMATSSSNSTPPGPGRLIGVIPDNSPPETLPESK